MREDLLRVSFIYIPLGGVIDFVCLVSTVYGGRSTSIVSPGSGHCLAAMTRDLQGGNLKYGVRDALSHLTKNATFQ